MDEPKSFTLAIRQAVRPWIGSAETKILVGVSGGTDSMALAIATIAECQKSGIEAIAIIIDHQLQDQSAVIAAEAQSQLRRMGYQIVEVMKVEVELTDGMEASARRVRYQAFEQAIDKYQPDYFFLAHTKSDQAESVLLGLSRGSGTRSLSGIAVENGKFIRPLLELDRETTEGACAENGIQPWLDPHNYDRHYARVRVRLDILPLLESNLGPGIIDSLARSAKILRQDADALDFLAAGYLADRTYSSLEIDPLQELPQAIRARVLRSAIYQSGAPEGSISADHLAPVEALITQWHGQGVVSLPGGVKVARISGRLSLSQQIS